MGKDAGRLLYWAIGKFIAMRSRHARHSALCSKDIEAISTRPTVTHSELQKLLGFCESAIVISQVLPFAGLMSQPGSSVHVGRACNQLTWTGRSFAIWTIEFCDPST